MLQLRAARTLGKGLQTVGSEGFPNRERTESLAAALAWSQAAVFVVRRSLQLVLALGNPERRWLLQRVLKLLPACRRRFGASL